MTRSLDTFNSAMNPTSRRNEGVDSYYLFNNGDVTRTEFPLPKILEEVTNRTLDFKKYPYSNPKGHSFARKKTALYERERSENSEISKKNIAITMGATNGLQLAIQAVKNLVEKGEILIPQVSYPVGPAIAEQCGFDVKYVPVCQENGFIPITEQIQALITNSTKALVLTSPNNPTGSEYSSEEIQKIADLCKEHGIYLIIDEIFSGLMLNGNKHPVPKYNIEEDLIIRINGWSKDRGVAGFRIGYMVAAEKFIDKVGGIINTTYGNAPTLFNQFIEKDMVHRRLMLNNPKIPYNLEDSHQQYRQQILRNLEKYEANELLAQEILNSVNRVLDFTETKGGFCKFIKFDTQGLSDKKFVHQLYQNTGVLLTPGTSFNPHEDGWARMTFAQPKFRVEQGLEALKTYCDR